MQHGARIPVWTLKRYSNLRGKYNLYKRLRARENRIRLFVHISKNGNDCRMIMIHLHHHKYGYVKYIYILYVTKVIYGNIIILTCTFEICIYDNMIVKIRVLLHFGLNSQLVKFNQTFHPSHIRTRVTRTVQKISDSCLWKRMLM